MNIHASNAHRLLLAALTAGTLALASPQTQGEEIPGIDEDIKLNGIGSGHGENFGNTVAIENNIIAVGAVSDTNENGLASGSVYLFDAITGSQTFNLLPDDGAESDLFGWDVDMDNGLIVIGSYGDDDNGDVSGSVYLFDAITGGQIRKITPNDGKAFDRFGWSVAISDGIIGVGAPDADDNGLSSGSVYLFDAFTGAQIAKLQPSDPAANDSFGTDIAIDNGVIAISMLGDDDNGSNAGAVYLFDTATGMEIRKLIADDGKANDWFGYRIDINDGTLVVGVPDASVDGNAYLFDAVTGTQMAKLASPESQNNGERFGSAVSIDNGVVAISSPVAAFNNDDAQYYASGLVFLFDASTSQQTATLYPSDPNISDNFGSLTAIFNGTVVVGVPNADGGNPNNTLGAAYVFTVPAQDCPADLTGDGSLNFFDVSAFLNAFSSQDPAADFTGDGSLNFFDVSAFLNAFSAGCP